MLKNSKEKIQTLTKDQLEEIQTYKTPPLRIKIALESIFLLQTGKVLSWDDIKKRMQDSDQFVNGLLKFSMAKVKPEVIKKFKENYLKNDDWNLEKLKRASQAMGPLGEYLESLEKQVEIIDSSNTPKIRKYQKAQSKLDKLNKESKKIRNSINQIENDVEEVKNRKTSVKPVYFNLTNINNYLENNTEVEPINTKKFNIKDEQELSEMMIIKKMEELRNNCNCKNQVINMRIINQYIKDHHSNVKPL